MAMVMSKRTPMAIVPTFIGKLAYMVWMIWRWPAYMMVPMYVMVLSTHRLLYFLIPARNCMMMNSA